MKLDYELEKICKVCISHFEELCEEDKERIFVFSISLDSQSIWGGNGDRDTDSLYYITKDGWKEETIVQEFGMYQKGDGIKSDSIKAVTSKDVESIINGDKATIRDIKQFLEFYDRIHDNYINDFKSY